MVLYRLKRLKFMTLAGAFIIDASQEPKLILLTSVDSGKLFIPFCDEEFFVVNGFSKNLDIFVMIDHSPVNAVVSDYLHYFSHY